MADLNAERIDFGTPKISSTPKTFIASNNVVPQNRNGARGVPGRTSTVGVDNNRNRTIAVKTPAQTEPVSCFQ